MSPEQKPPKSPEQHQLVHDFRFTEELVDALKGDAGLAGLPSTVTITGYIGTDESGDAIKHYIEYEDENGEKKPTTLDQFVWANLSDERKGQLKKVGLKADDLDIGTDPILKPINHNSFPNVDPDKADLYAFLQIVARESAKAGAMEAVAALTGRRKSRENEAENGNGEKSLPIPIPENFEARVAARTERHQTVESEKPERGFSDSREAVLQRERVAKLSKIAKAIAEQMNTKRQAEADRIAKRNLENQRTYHPQINPRSNQYDTDTTVQDITYDYKKSRFAKINKIDRGRKIIDTKQSVYAEGWVIARKPVPTAGRLLTEEVLLGTDGRLHAYMHEGLANVNSLQGSAFSRKDIQDSAFQELAPPHRTTTLAPKGQDLSINHQTLTEDNDYPILGIEKRHPDEIGERGITLELIQKGMEELVAEHNLRPPAS